MPAFSPSNSLCRLCGLLLLLLYGIQTHGQAVFPSHEGERARYQVQIDIKKAYISGVSIMLYEHDTVKGSIFNEFGVSAIDFTYFPAKDKVKINHAMQRLNKWYIKKLLRKDLLQVIRKLKAGNTYYENKKYQITYSFSPLTDTGEQNEKETTDDSEEQPISD